MPAVVDHNPSSGDRGVLAPVDGQGRDGRLRAQHADLGVTDGAESAAGSDFQKTHPLRGVSPVIHGINAKTSRLGFGTDILEGRRIQGQGLLAQDMQARLQAGEHRVRVIKRRGSDDQGVQGLLDREHFGVGRINIRGGDGVLRGVTPRRGQFGHGLPKMREL